MAEYTKNLNLKKPAPDDFVDVADLNGNFDIIDEKISEVRARGVFYGVCDTYSPTAAKVVNVGEGFILEEGVTVKVLFTKANTASNPTLNVNNTGAFYISYNDTLSMKQYGWKADILFELTYTLSDINGESMGLWRVNDTIATNQVYGNVMLSSDTASNSGVNGGIAATPSAVKAAMDKASAAYVQTEKNKVWQGTCDTAMDVGAKEVNVGEGFELKEGVKIRVYFNFTNSARDILTLNVNNTGAFDILLLDGGELPYNFISQGYYDFTYTETPWSGDSSVFPVWMIDNIKIAGQSNYGVARIWDRSSATMDASTGTAVSPKALQAVKNIADAALPKTGGHIEQSNGSPTQLMLTSPVHQNVPTVLMGTITEGQVFGTESATCNISAINLTTDGIMNGMMLSNSQDSGSIICLKGKNNSQLMIGSNDFSYISGLDAPTEDTDAVNKQYVDKQIEKNKVWQGICNTAMTEAAKEVNVGEDFELYDGVKIRVHFKNGNTATGSVTLNVNGTGAFEVIPIDGGYLPSNFITADTYWDLTYTETSWGPDNSIFPLWMINNTRIAGIGAYGVVKVTDTPKNTFAAKNGYAASPKSVYDVKTVADAALPKASVLRFKDVTIAANSNISDATYDGYPVRYDIPCTDVTSNYSADVMFAPSDAVSGNFAPFCDTGEGIVKIYAKSVPTSDIVNIIIPAIICRKMVD